MQGPWTRWARLALGAGVLLALGACGSNAAPVTPPPTPAPATATSAPPPAETPAAALPAATAPVTFVPSGRPGTVGTVVAPITPAADAAQVQVHTEFYTDTYRLLADTCQVASDYMHEHGPGGWPAETRLTFEFYTPPVPLHFTTDEGGNFCVNTPLDVSATVLTFTLRITLPEWDALGQTGCLGAAREWDTVLNALTIHEHGHADRYQARYQEWADKVSGRLAAAQISACATTRSAVTAAAQQQIDSIIRGISDQLQDEIADDPEQNRYEQETQHGIKQGAIFHEEACRCLP